MNGEITNILDNIGGDPLKGLGINFVGLLKLPVIVILFGNLLFAALLFLRSRILADTFESSNNKIIKIIISTYLVVTIIGSILAVLFLLVG